MEQKTKTQNWGELGKIETCLNQDFDRLPPEQVYKEYEMEVPGDVMDFCKIIESEGGRALLVGGCVRDMIISSEKSGEKVAPQDIDIEVYGLTHAHLMKMVVMMYGNKGEETHGNKFELISVNSREDKNIKFDISIPREDNKTGVGNKGFEVHSHPEFTIMDGARRRDTTCNSMAYDPLVKVTYDPFNGKQDILDGVLRATDEDKFIEDPVRILRIMRFAARYGWRVAPETEALCVWMMDKTAMRERQKQRYEKARGMGKFDQAEEILEKSAVELDDETKERLYAEFAKMFTEGGNPSIGLEFARNVGVIDRYFPWLAELTVTEQEYSWHPEGNAWKHTLQVIDAAVEIAKRENLNKEETLELVASSLSHDLGKPSTTKLAWKEISGERKQVITSDGHDTEGGWLSSEFINAFAPKATVKIERDEKGEYLGLAETDFAKELRGKVKILTERHMQLKSLYLLYMEEREKNQGAAEKKARRSLGKLARKLAEKGTDVFMLSYVTEADQRGRNEKSNKPMEREEVKDLVNWQTWLAEKMSGVEIKKELPKMIVEGEMVKKETGLGDGVVLGVVISWIFDDQLAGEFTTPQEGLKRASEYSEKVKECIRIAGEENWKTVARFNNKKPPRLEDEMCKWLKEDGVREKVLSSEPDARLSILEKVVDLNAERVSRLGEWPEYIKAGSLLDRVPKIDGGEAPGFDAGVACALDLIPRDKQELAARLHANYSKEAIEQVRRELAQNDPDSPTTWWLAACAICMEGEVDRAEFLKQVGRFKILASDPEKRLAAAKEEFEKMKSSFEVVKGIPYGTKDGCMQAAYIAGYPVAVMYAEKYGVYFVGTYLPSVGLDGFEWSNQKDENGNAKSGPVYGSKQFMKCANEDELGKVLEKVGRTIQSG